MNCPECGAMVYTTDKFCGSCGAKLSSQTTRQSAPLRPPRSAPPMWVIVLALTGLATILLLVFRPDKSQRMKQIDKIDKTSQEAKGEIADLLQQAWEVGFADIKQAFEQLNYTGIAADAVEVRRLVRKMRAHLGYIALSKEDKALIEKAIASVGKDTQRLRDAALLGHHRGHERAHFYHDMLKSDLETLSVLLRQFGVTDTAPELSRKLSPPKVESGYEEKPQVVAVKPQTFAQGDGYISLESSQRYLTEADLAGRSAWELTLMRNEIYARHGRPFRRREIREYFLRQSWYQPDPSFTDARLSPLEKRNAVFILNYQKRYGKLY